MDNRTLDPSTKRYTPSPEELTKTDKDKSVIKEKNILDKLMDLIRNNPYIVSAVIISFMMGYLIASRQEHKQCNQYIKNRAQMKKINTNASLASNQAPPMQAPQMQASQMQAPQMQQPQMQQPQMQ